MSALATAAAGLDVEEAAERAARGELLAYPTETVWGLGADARSEDAVERLRRFKGRDAERPMAVLVPDLETLLGLGASLDAGARRLADAFWPGPLTLVLRCAAALARGVARADGALGFRCSPHATARALARAVARRGVGPLTATSLNRTGRPPARSHAEAAALCGASGPWLVSGDEAGGARESSVVDASGATPRLLREGALSAESLSRVLGARLSP